jgi:hypothetical protein
MFAARFGGRGAVSFVFSSIITTALPDGSSLVTTRRISGAGFCCAMT